MDYGTILGGITSGITIAEKVTGWGVSLRDKLSQNITIESAVIAVPVEELIKNATAMNELYVALEKRTKAVQEQEFKVNVILEQLNDFLVRKENYTLTALSPNSFAYAFKPPAGSIEPAHNACSHCFGQYKISTLQFHEQDYSFDILKCHTCGQTARLAVDRGDTVMIASVRGSKWDGFI